MIEFQAKELVTFLAELSVSAEAVISTDPEVEDDAVKIGGQLEVQIGDSYMVLSNTRWDGAMIVGCYRQSYDEIIADVIETLKGEGLHFTPLSVCLEGHRFTGLTPEALALKVRRYIREEGFGASDIGSRFRVRHEGSVIGWLSYNGRFTKDSK